jgi:hypothetical protein
MTIGSEEHVSVKLRISLKVRVSMFAPVGGYVTTAERTTNHNASA